MTQEAWAVLILVFMAGLALGAGASDPPKPPDAVDEFLKGRKR